MGTFLDTMSEKLWFMTTGAQAELLHRIDTAQMRADDRVGFAYNQQVEVLRNVAVIPIHGVLDNLVGQFEKEYYGVRDQQDIQKQLMNIIDDDGIDTVVFHFNTSGGGAEGHLETLEVMDRLRASGKTLVAFSNGDCASLGYYLAAGCDQLISTPTARWGSISGYFYMNDYSGTFDAQGIQVKGYKTGKFKAMGYPGLEITDEQVANLVETWAPSEAEFKNFVAERRGLSADLMEGQYWRAKDAPAGVIDGLVNSMDELLAVLVD